MQPAGLAGWSTCANRQHCIRQSRRARPVIEVTDAAVTVMGGKMSEPTNDQVRSDFEIRSHLLDDVTVKARATHFPQRKNFVSAWYGRMQRANQLSGRFKVGYYLSLAVSSLAAASVPTLIGAAGSSDAQSANLMRILAAGLGVFVAVTTSVLGVVQVGNRWRVYRIYGQSLEEAGWDYLASDGDGSGSSDGEDSGYRDFVKAVTNAHRTYCREYLNHVAVRQESVASAATGASSS
jgi:Protein of unknown function (DUF4231)